MAARSHLLVRRIEEETISLVPSRALNVHEGEATTAGNLCEVKWVRKCYEGEIPSVSDDREALSKMIDHLVNNKVYTKEEFLGTTEHSDDLHCEAPDNNTTSSPSMQKMSHDSNHSEGSSFSKKDEREDENNSSVKAAKIVAAAKKRVREIMSKIPYSGKIDDEQQLTNEIEQLQKELADLKKQIESRRRDNSPLVGKNSVKPQFNSSHNTIENDLPENIINISDSDDEIMTTELLTGTSKSPGASSDHSQMCSPHYTTSIRESDNYDDGISASMSSSQDISKEIKNPETENGIRISRNNQSPPKEHLETLDDNYKPISRQVELVEGYGIYISLRQLDEANDQSANSPTKLLRKLLTIFFEPSVLAVSTCQGNRTHPALNPDILGACFRYVQMRHPHVSRTVLVDCVNDKCANYRRKKHL